MHPRLATAVASAIAASLLGTAAYAQSGGLFLPENGGPSNGTAQAGSAAIARDAETAFLNPAGMMRLEDTELMGTLMPFYLDYSFNEGSGTTLGGGDGGQQGGWLPAAGLFLAVPLNETFAFGFSSTAPAGLGLDPDDDWVGRSWASEVELIVLNFEPSLGIRLNDAWSLGVGLDVQYATFEQKLTGPLAQRRVKIDGDSWDVGASASALWEITDTTRLGIRYRTKVSHDLDGDFTLNLAAPQDISTALDLPQSVTVSAYHELSPTFSLMLDVGWTNWDDFERNVITFDASGRAVELPRNFKDVWNVSLGAHARITDAWLLMFGVGYTSSAVDDEFRTPDMPVDEQWRLSVGAEYALNERWNIGMSYTLLWLGDNEIDQTRPFGLRRLEGDYDAMAHIFGAYASVKF